MRSLRSTVLMLAVMAGLSIPSLLAQNVIVTVAGKEFVYPRSPTSSLNAPLGPVVDVAWAADTLYIADPRNRLVLRRNRTGSVSVFAGNGFNISSGDGGPADAAGLRAPSGLAVGRDGSVYIADADDHRIRRVLPDGTIETFAGNGQAGSRGDGLSARAASLNSPRQMAFDGMGNLYVAEFGGNRIRRIDSSGLISTAADGVRPTAVVADLQGNIWFGDAAGLKRFPAGRPADLEVVGPGLTIGGLTVDPMGVITWSTAERHQVFSLAGTTGQIIGNGSGSLIVGNGFPGSAGDGGLARDGRVNNPLGIDYSADGRLAIADSGNGLVRQVDADLMLSRIAGSQGFRFTGDGGFAPLATLNSPQGLAITAAGELLIADTNSNRIRVVDQSGRIDSLAGGAPGGDALNPQGLSGPTDVVATPQGEIYVADRGNLRVARLTGDVPETVAGGGFVRNSDGGPATEARLFDPTDIAFDMAGNLLITDRADHRVRRVSPGGVIDTMAGTGQQGSSGDNGPATRAALDGPSSVAVGPSGEAYIADEASHRLRVVSPDGTIRRVAGGGGPGFSGDGQAARQAQLNTPRGVAVSANGAVYIADTDNHRVRRVGTDQVIETIAGNGAPGFSGDGSLAVEASLNSPTAVAVDQLGNVFIADEGNDRVRVVLENLPRFRTDVVGVDDNVIALRTLFGEDSPAQVIRLQPDVQGLRYRVRLFEDGVERESLPWLEISPLSGAMPAAVRVSGKGLAEGAFRGQIGISISGVEQAEPALIDVELSVDPVPLATCPNDCTTTVPAIAHDRKSLVFGTFEGGARETIVIEPELVFLRPAALTSALTQASIAVEQAAEFDLFARATTTDGLNWLSVTPRSTMTVDREAPPFEVSADPRRLAVGTYTGVIELGGDGIPVASLPVTMTVAPARPVLTLDRTGLTFRAVSQGPRPLERLVTITNTGTGRMTWRAEVETLSGGPWLSVTPAAGDVIAQTADLDELVVSVNPAGLAPGDYFGSIEVTAPGVTPQSVTVIFNVVSPSEMLPPDVSRNGLVFIASGDQNPSSQTVTIANLNPTEVGYAISLQGEDNAGRLLFSPSLGVLGPGERETIQVQPDFALAPLGASRERLTVDFNLAGSSDVEVTNVKTALAFALTEEGRPAGGGCETSSLIVTPVSGAGVVRHPKGQPLALEAIVLDNCGRPLTSDRPGANVRFTAAGAGFNLQHKAEGLWTGSFQPGGNLGQINGTYTAFLGFLPAQADITIEIIDGADVPLISSGGLVNAASFEQAPQISPGSLISLFGESLAEGSTAATTAPLPDTLSGSTVKLGDRTLKLFFAGGNQINAQIPFDIEPNLQHRIEIRRGNAASVPEQVTVAPTQPGIFAVNQAGSGQAVIVDALTFVVADTQSPARAGDAMSAFCTGLGAVDPPAPVGEQAPFDPLSRTVNEVTVLVDGRPAQMLFAGLAPGFAGLYQVNFVIPAGVTPGPAVPVTLTVDGKTSPPVTIAVE